MKRTINLLATLVVASIMSLGLSSCGTDEPEQPEPVFVDMGGTSWEAEEENIYTFNYQGYGIEMDISLIMILDVLDESNAELFSDLTITTPDAPTASQRQLDTDTCTYTFDGMSLVLTSKKPGVATGNIGTMVYDKETNTFTMSIRDGQLKLLLEKNNIEFHQTRGGQI